MEKIGEIHNQVKTSQDEISRLDVQLDTLQKRRDEVDINFKCRLLLQKEKHLMNNLFIGMRWQTQ